MNHKLFIFQTSASLDARIALMGLEISKISTVDHAADHVVTPFKVWIMHSATTVDYNVFEQK